MTLVFPNQMTCEFNVLEAQYPFVFFGKGGLLTLADITDLPRFSRLCLLDFYHALQDLLHHTIIFTSLLGFVYIVCPLKERDRVTKTSVLNHLFCHSLLDFKMCD